MRKLFNSGLKTNTGLFLMEIYILITVVGNPILLRTVAFFIFAGQTG
jgi:hypothetical protein